MPRKQPDLKKRLNELRDASAPQVELILLLDADLLKELKTRARRKRQTIEAYVGDLLANHVDNTTE